MNERTQRTPAGTLTDTERDNLRASHCSCWGDDYLFDVVADIKAAAVAAALAPIEEALEGCREQRADLLELVQVERQITDALRSAVQDEIDSAYRVGANYVPCGRLRAALAGGGDPAVRHGRGCAADVAPGARCQCAAGGGDRG